MNITQEYGTRTNKDYSDIKQFHGQIRKRNKKYLRIDEGRCMSRVILK